MLNRLLLLLAGIGLMMASSISGRAQTNLVPEGDFDDLVGFVLDPDRVPPFWEFARPIRNSSFGCGTNEADGNAILLLSSQTNEEDIYAFRIVPIHPSWSNFVLRCSIRSEDIVANPEEQFSGIHASGEWAGPNGNLEADLLDVGRPIALNSEWTHYEGRATKIPPGAVKLRLMLGLYRTSGRVSFDNLAVYADVE